MKSEAEVRAKIAEIDELRQNEVVREGDEYQRGELAGVQQALYWALGEGADPMWVATGRG